MKYLGKSSALLAAVLMLQTGWAGRRAAEHDSAAFERTLAEIEMARKNFQRRLNKASCRQEKDAVRAEARQYVVQAIVEKIIPAWLGVPWTMAVIDDGLQPNATVPFEAGKGISCSWFLVSVLRNAGLRFVSPRAFAGSIAVHFQYALSPRDADLHRFFHVTPSRLAEKIASLGDGLYVIGLNCHIGFVHVAGDRVRILHSSYISPATVVIEPLIESPAVSASQEAGYVVSPLFQDIRLIDYWLTGNKVPFKRRPINRGGQYGGM